MRTPYFDLVPYRGTELLHGKVLYPPGITIREEKLEFEIKQRPYAIKHIIEEHGFSQGTNYLINSMTFSGVDYSIADKGDHFLISGDSQKIYLSKKGSRIISDSKGKIEFTARARMKNSKGETLIVR